jgi:hypothetical protein
MTIGRLAPLYQGRVLLPVLGKVTATSYTDRVRVQLVFGPVRGRLRRPGRGPRPRVRRHAVPHPLRLAGHLAGVAVIGYADKPGKAQALAGVQAAAVTTDLAEITTALRNTA